MSSIGECICPSRKIAIAAFGCYISEKVSDAAAHPFAQIAMLLFCAAWFLFGLRADILTAGLSILAITLTQMVLNRQQEREAEAHRRDVAMHAKLDELLRASRRARDELAGIEEMEEEEIQRLSRDPSLGTASTVAARTGGTGDSKPGRSRPAPAASRAGPSFNIVRRARASSWRVSAVAAPQTKCAAIISALRRGGCSEAGVRMPRPGAQPK